MINWSHIFETNHEGIDEQHKKMIDIIQKLHHAIENESEDMSNLLKILHELDIYANDHFDYEEELMKRYEYPDKEEHIKAHKLFKDKLIDLNIGSVKKDVRLDYLNQMLVYTAFWLSEHIIKIDNMLGAFLSEQKVEV